MPSLSLAGANGGGLDRCGACFARSDANGLVYVKYENLSVANLACERRALDHLHSAVGKFIGHHSFNLYFGQKINRVFGAAIDFCLALLSAITFDFSDG